MDPATLSAPIRATLAREWPDATVTGVEVEDGETEVELATGTSQIDVAFRADGTWKEAKTHVALASLPEAVRAAASAHGKITEAERRATPDGRSDWELEVKGRGGSTILRLDDTGHLLSTSREDEDEDEEEDDE